MSPATVENWIVRLRQRLEAQESLSTTQSSALDLIQARLATLEALLLNVPSQRLLGRYDAGAGVVQFVRIGTGLDLVGDELVNTGGGGGDGGTGSRGFSGGFSSGFA